MDTRKRDIKPCPKCGRLDIDVIRPMQPAATHVVAAWCNTCSAWTGQEWDDTPSYLRRRS